MGKIRMKVSEDFGRIRLDYAVNEFIRHCRLRNLSQETQKYYQEDLNYFCRVMELTYHYIMLCRIDKAKHLLHASKDSIHTVGQLAGFPSDANFVRVFTKYTGYSPSAFRRMGL